MKNKKGTILFLNIDGVIVVGGLKTKLFPWDWHELFDKKCVDVLNVIYDEILFEIVISFDWKNYYNFNELKKMLVGFNIKAPFIDITSNSKNYTIQNLEGGGIEEIEVYLDKYKDNILAWVSVDDLNLNNLNYFVRTVRWAESIK